MNSDIQQVFEKIQSFTREAKHNLILHDQLFDSGPEVIKLISKKGGNVFSTFQKLVIDNLILYFSKLIDAPKMGSNDNLSLLKLAEMIEIDDVDLFNKIKSKMDNIISKARKFKQQRHKRVAHSDEAYHFNREDGDSLGFSFDDIDKTLNLIGIFLNEIELHYHNSETAYEHLRITVGNDANALLTRLRKAERYDKLIQKIRSDMTPEEEGNHIMEEPDALQLIAPAINRSQKKEEAR